MERCQETGACLVSCNRYGNGKAFYTSSQMDHSVMIKLIQSIEKELGLSEVMDVPEGIQVREIAKGQYYFVNNTEIPLQITLPGNGHLVLHDKKVSDIMILDAFDVDLFVQE